IANLDAASDYTFRVRAIKGTMNADSDPCDVTTLPADISIGPDEQIDQGADGTDYVLNLEAHGVDPSSLTWTITWGDDSTDTTIDPNSPGSWPRAVSHHYDRDEFAHSYSIHVTADDGTQEPWE